MGKIVNQSELALIFGKSLPTIQSWQKEGCPVEKQGGRGTSHQFDTEKVFQWLFTREKRPGRPSTKEREPAVDPETGERRVSLEEAQRRKAIADAKKSELDLAQKLELVAPVETIAKIVSDEIANARARLLAIPTKLRPAAQMHAASPEKAKKLVAAVDDLIREAMTEIKTYGGGNG